MKNGIRLVELNILNFRNINQLYFEFESPINFFVGSNGVGKTNILNAISYLSYTKSAFATSDKQNIKKDESLFIIKGSFYKDSKFIDISCGYQLGEAKNIRVDEEPVTKFSNHIGFIPLVVASPIDISIINDGGEEHRKLLNNALSQLNSAYLADLLNYNSLLVQRNSLLKSHSIIDKYILETFDFRMTHLAMRIYECRKNFIVDVNKYFSLYFSLLSNDQAVCADIIYESHLTESNYLKRLESNLDRDIYLKYTSMGIHRDRLRLTLSGNDIRKYGSQGEQKSFMLALKLAQVTAFVNIYNICPIVILDDLFDKLDYIRSEKLILLISNITQCQFFISESNEDRLKKMQIEDNPLISIFKI